MFVIMCAVGEYSDRSVSVLGYNQNEDRAKEIVKELVKEDQRTKSIDRTKSKIWGEAYTTWEQNNVAPVFGEERPKFDQNRHGDKQYVAEHTERKYQFKARENQFHTDVFVPYSEKRAEFIQTYIDEHFDENNLLSFEWTDTQFWYEPVKEML